MMNRLVNEGKAIIQVPEESERRKSSTFFNPYMRFDRDLTCEILRLLGGKGVCDALCGSGVRAIRYALESSCVPWANDSNPRASRLAEANMRKNGLDFPITNVDANILLREQKFDVVDIDPFGSPVSFLDSAMCALHKDSYLFLTATDTAALYGSAPSACLRKYNVLSIKTDFSKELGVRILLGAVMRVASQHSYALEVLLAYVQRHYVRAFLKVKRGKRKAASSFEGMGFVFVCSCGFHMVGRKLMCSCPLCGKRLIFTYPVYVESLKQDSFICRLSDNGILKKIKEEANIPLYYDVHRIASASRLAPPKLEDLISRLKEAGFYASKTHFCPTGIKTNAQIDEILPYFSRKHYK